MLSRDCAFDKHSEYVDFRVRRQDSGKKEVRTVRAYTCFLGAGGDEDYEIEDLEEELMVLFSRVSPRAAAYLSSYVSS